MEEYNSQALLDYQDAIALFDFHSFDDWVASLTNEEIAELIEIYEPSPKLENAGVPADFTLDDSGVYATVGDGEARVCSPLIVDALLADQDRVNFGFRLKFVNRLGEVQSMVCPADIVAARAETLQKELLLRGVRIYDLKLLVLYINEFQPPMTLRCVLQTGWHDGAYVLPDGCVNGQFVYQGREESGEIGTGGTLEEWQSEIAARATGNDLVTTALASAFAGPLLSKIGMDGGGVHFVGDSSIGKSTLLEVAASVWGPRRFVKSWRTTGNGLEGVAASRNDGLLLLDEISQAEPKEVGQIAYAISNGRGKQRAAVSGDARRVKEWRVMCLSSGEKSLQTYMESGKQAVNAGHAVRLIDVPAHRQYGIYDDLHGYASGVELSNALKSASNKHFGHAALLFLEKLADDGRNFHAEFEKMKSRFLHSDGQQARVAARFAAIALAGELATEYGVTGWESNVATDSLVRVFEAWRNARKGNTEHDRIVQQVLDYVSRFTDSRFTDLHDRDARCCGVRSGWHYEKDGQRVFLLHSAGMHDALSGYDFDRALSVLIDAGVLPERGSDGKIAQNVRTPEGVKKLYSVTSVTSSPPGVLPKTHQ